MMRCENRLPCRVTSDCFAVFMFVLVCIDGVTPLLIEVLDFITSDEKKLNFVKHFGLVMCNY